MADVSQVSMTAVSPVKDVKVKKRPAKKKASAAAASTGVDAETTAALELKAATQQEPSHSTTKEGDASIAPTHRKRQHYKKPSAVVETAAGEPAEARGTTSVSKKRASAKHEPATVADDVEDVSKARNKTKKHSKRDSKPTWPFLRLSEPLGKSSRLPPVFSHDGRFCFVAAANSVKIYLVSSSQLLSTLDLPSQPGTNDSGTGRDNLHRTNNQITSLFVSPTNTLQVITTSLDGFIRVWDFLEGKVLYTINMGGPIACAAMPNANADSSAESEDYLKDSMFLAVNRDKESDDTPPNSGPQIPTSVVFWVSLKRSREPKQVRLGKCKDALDLSVSSDGSRVVVIGRKKIHIARIGSTTGSKANSGVPMEIKGPFLSFEGLPSQSHYRDVVFTTVVCHPTESYFATGDTRGTIRLWYILSDESLAAIEASQEQLRNKVGGNKKTAESIIPTEAVTVWHWHAHAVSSLAFTPNGAYLISGGEEAVMIIWQISSQHKEFVPRLGAPIEALTIVHGQSGQQEYVARLKDGTLVFVGAGTLKVVRAIAGVKAIGSFAQKKGSKLPLAIEPYTNRLVFQASTPSTIQFYSASQDTHVYEQDISPSNRVSRTDDRAIEPTRVEGIAFSGPSSASTSSIVGTSSSNSSFNHNDDGGRVWMATFDTWQDRDYTRESHLKIWVGYPKLKPGYSLVTRIDNPHGQDRITSMAFAPVSSATTNNGFSDGGAPRLVTTSLDGTIKLWTHRLIENTISAVAVPTSTALTVAAPGDNDTTPTDGGEKKRKHKRSTLNKQTASARLGIWQCLFSLTYRSLPALTSTFSPDGSLLAISHNEGKITLWDVQTGNLIKAFNAPVEEVGHTLKSVAFVGRLGTKLVAAGEKGQIIWDLLTCEELATLPLPATHVVIPSAQSHSGAGSEQADSYITLFEKTATLVSMNDFKTRKIQLPFSVAEAISYPLQSQSQSTPYTATATSISTSTSTSTVPSHPQTKLEILSKDAQIMNNLPLAIASISKSGQVALFGSETALRSIRPAAFENQANLQAALDTYSTREEGLKPIRLFDELFGGPSLLTSTSTSTSASTANAAAMPAMPTLPPFFGNTKGKGRDLFDEIPSHKLPSLSTVWRDLLGPKLKPLDPSSSSSLVASTHSPAKTQQVKAAAAEEQAEDDDEESDEDERNKADADMQVDTEVPVEKEHETVGDEDLEEVVSIPEAELIKIFKASAKIQDEENEGSNNNTSMTMTPDRLAGKGGNKDKSKKKRKSLLASMV